MTNLYDELCLSSMLDHQKNLDVPFNKLNCDKTFVYANHFDIYYYIIIFCLPNKEREKSYLPLTENLDPELYSSLSHTIFNVWKRSAPLMIVFRLNNEYLIQQCTTPDLFIRLPKQELTKLVRSSSPTPINVINI